MHDGRQKHFGGGVVIDDGGVVIDDGGAVEVWCGYGGAVGIMLSLKSLKKTNGWKEIIKKY